MKKKITIGLLIVFCMAIFGTVFPQLKPKEEQVVRVYQHEEDTLANPETGVTQIDESGLVDESFETHLPLVILDVSEDDIKNIFTINAAEEKVYIDSDDTDPWTEMTIRIIDNGNGESNCVSDEPSVVNTGKIKLRGMSSRSFAKKQYGIKLMDGEEELELSLLGMDADEDWVLSNSELDLSGLRNYMALNIGGQIFPNTPEAKFCEVIMHDGDTYEYKGLYLLVEKIKQGDGRVEIDDYDESARSLSYIICRDRWSESGIMLSTWASDQQLCYGYFSLIYPKEANVSEEGIQKMEEELSTIESVLYSDDPDVFLTYSRYIDVDSFVDYFLVNELFMNFDAGSNSTYYYKNEDGKLAMGILWDYDNCLDNYNAEIAGIEYVTFVEKPWFELLIQDEAFQERLVSRYEELRKSIFSDEYIDAFLDETLEYLGYASDRNFSRWYGDYVEEHLLKDVENPDGFILDRNTGSVEAEVQRMKDTYHLHTQWLDESFEDFLDEYVNEEFNVTDSRQNQLIAILVMLGLLSMVGLITRYMKGNVR